jgi:hypothetical protein
VIGVGGLVEIVKLLVVAEYELYTFELSCMAVVYGPVVCFSRRQFSMYNVASNAIHADPTPILVKATDECCAAHTVPITST